MRRRQACLSRGFGATEERRSSRSLRTASPSCSLLVTLDVKNADAREALDTLIAGADVLVKNAWYAAGLPHVWLPYMQMKRARPPLPVVRTQGSRR